MVVAWIVITLMLALLVGVIYGATSGEFEFGEAFLVAFLIVCQLLFYVGIIYVAAHFIGKYW
jgi:hypothetical protein